MFPTQPGLDFWKATGKKKSQNKHFISSKLNSSPYFLADEWVNTFQLEAGTFLLSSLASLPVCRICSVGVMKICERASSLLVSSFSLPTVCTLWQHLPVKEVTKQQSRVKLFGQRETWRPGRQGLTLALAGTSSVSPCAVCMALTELSLALQVN